MDRRAFLRRLGFGTVSAAAAAVTDIDLERLLWVPGEKVWHQMPGVRFVSGERMSVRLTQHYDLARARHITRFDVLYGTPLLEPWDAVGITESGLALAPAGIAFDSRAFTTLMETLIDHENRAVAHFDDVPVRRDGLGLRESSAPAVAGADAGDIPGVLRRGWRSLFDV